MSVTINGIIYPIDTTTRVFIRPPSDNDGWGEYEHPKAVGFRLVLPENIGDLTNLTELDIGYCNVDRIPESIGHLGKLEFLYSNDNNLISLPESIGNLTKLKKLNLYMNDLTSLPETIGNLINLRGLDLSFNTRLRELPYSMGSLPNLRKIEISETAFGVDKKLAYASTGKIKDYLQLKLQEELALKADLEK